MNPPTSDELDRQAREFDAAMRNFTGKSRGSMPMDDLEEYYNRFVLQGQKPPKGLSFAELPESHRKLIRDSFGFAGYQINKSAERLGEAIKRASIIK